MVLEGISLSFSEDFLHSRQQKVIVYGVTSHIRPVISGVPQASALEPLLLFLISTSDLASSAENELMEYKDDSTLVISISSSEARANAGNVN